MNGVLDGVLDSKRDMTFMSWPSRPHGAIYPSRKICGINLLYQGLMIYNLAFYYLYVV